MTANQNFDRWACAGAALIMAAIAVAGMWFNKPDIAHFGEIGFASFSSVLIALLNKELLNGNGKNGNGSGNGNPMP